MRLLRSQLVDVLLHAAVMRLEEVEAFLQRGRVGAEVAVAAELGDRHPGVAQAPDEAQPVDVALAVRAPAAARALDGAEQPRLLVVAQGIEAESCVLGDLSRRES